MARLERPTNNPKIVALGILALRSYARGVSSGTQFEVEMSKALKDLGVSTTTAKRLIANFDRISPRIRQRIFGPLGLSNAQMPASVKRDSVASNSLPRGEFLSPGTVTQTAILGTAGIEFAGNQNSAEEQILAPERYTISYQGMHCIDETGITDFGSDEIYIITSAIHIKPDGTNTVTTVRHPLRENGAGTYEDVDTHETRIGPVASCWSAQVADTSQGMSLTTVVMEHDHGDPDFYRDEVDAAVKLALAAAALLFPLGAPLLLLIDTSGLVTDFFTWVFGSGDDKIGTVTSVLELSELETFSRTRLSSFRAIRNGKQVDTGLKHHFLAPVNNSDSRYVAGLRVTRIPVAPLFPSKVIN
jgi:hypothetical protein